MEAATAVAPAPAPAPPRRRKNARESSSTWRLTDRIGLALCWFLGGLFCALALAIVGFMAVQGLRYVRPALLFQHPAVGFTESQTGGFLDPLLGTLIVAVLSLAIALPVGIATAVWLTEYGRPFALARVVESTVEMIAGTPAIVLALFGSLVFTNPALGFLSRTSGGVVFGRSFFAASAMLSLVALPLIVSSTREGLQSIPAHVREASYAVGKTKLATIRRILLPTARPSVVTGAMLGVGRVIGDTAIIVVLLGATLNFNSEDHTPLLGALKGTGSTLTSYVYSNAPTGEGNQPEKAYAAAFILLVIVLLLNACVEIVSRRARATAWNS
jgi:phosphate transport system permease protein